MRTFAEIIRWRATRHPELRCVRDATRGLTYAQIDSGSTQIACGLRERGISRGDRVAILDKNSATYIELLVALAKLGAVAAPVNWRLTPREVAAVVGDAGATLLVVGGELRSGVEELGETLGIPLLDIEALPRAAGDDPAQDEDAGVLWQLSTSGTTGVPKGAMLTNANLFACVDGIILECPEAQEGTTSLVAMPLYHIGGCGWAAAMLFCGTSIVVVREIVPDQLLHTIVEERVVAAFLVPAVLLFLSQLPDAQSADLSALGRILYGASPITPELLTRCIELFGCQFTQVYGLTETTGAIVSLRHEDHTPERLSSCGRASLGVDVRIVDPSGAELAQGETGELLVRCAALMDGYRGRPEETRAAITDGWFHTGDAASIDELGYITIRDRVKDMIVSGGENVYPVEIEAVLAEHPQIADVAVIGVPDERWGETVKAVVVSRDGATLHDADVLDWCRERLAGYKRPTSVDIVEQIPRNPTGKVLKRVLREQYWAAETRAVRGSG